MAFSPDNLRQKRDIAQAVFMRFTRLYEQDKFALFCFFEGEDVKYYGIRIKTIARPESYHSLDCKGKVSVLKVFEILFNRPYYQSAQKAYFIDKDFDPSIKASLPTEDAQKIYETPCYSIENFYTSIDCFSEILKSEFKLQQFEPDFDHCLDLYTQLQAKFHLQIGLFNAYIACCRKNREEMKLSGFKIDKLIRINLENITSNYSLEDLNTKFSPQNILSENEIQQKLSELQAKNPQQSFRGKFEIEFLRKIIVKLIERANKGDQDYFSQKYKLTLKIPEDNLLSTFSQYADTPDCLQRFAQLCDTVSTVSKIILSVL
jgi:hypothetical protein